MLASELETLTAAAEQNPALIRSLVDAIRAWKDQQISDLTLAVNAAQAAQKTAEDALAAANEAHTKALADAQTAADAAAAAAQTVITNLQVRLLAAQGDLAAAAGAITAASTARDSALSDKATAVAALASHQTIVDGIVLEAEAAIEEALQSLPADSPLRPMIEQLRLLVIGAKTYTEPREIARLQAEHAQTVANADALKQKLEALGVPA